MTAAPIPPAEAAGFLIDDGVMPDALTSGAVLASALMSACARRGLRVGRLERASLDLPTVRDAMWDALAEMPAPRPRTCPACRATLH